MFYNIFIMKTENFFLKLFRITLLLLLLPAVIIYVVIKKIKASKQKKLNADKIKVMSASQIDELSGVEFEILLKDLFEKMGYKVTLTKASHDYGADLIVSKGKNSSLVQAKRYSHSVGIRAIQEIIGAKRHYNVQNAIVISNQLFTKDAQILSVENDVNLIDRTALLNLIIKHDITITRLKVNLVALNKKSISQIEQKYPSWI